MSKFNKVIKQILNENQLDQVYKKPLSVLVTEKASGLIQRHELAEAIQNIINHGTKHQEADVWFRTINTALNRIAMSDVKITSLEGAPKKIEGLTPRLTSLEGAPKAGKFDPKHDNFDPKKI